MNWTPDLALVEYALDELEQHEAKLLVWGLVDAAMTEDEVHGIVRDLMNTDKVTAILAHADCTLFDEATVINRLKDERLLFERPFDGGFRTRMAESVRLFSRLRQMFAKHNDGDRWTMAPTLVADYRLLWRRRKYPDRNISKTVALDDFDRTDLSLAARNALRHRLSGESASWSLARFQVDATVRILSGLENGKPQGTMVAAGTGSGKTLAFYLPGLSAAVTDIEQSSRAGTRILAVYPRNELLKDQFSEIFKQCRKFDSYLAGKGLRKLTVGVLGSDTKISLKSIRGPDRPWKKSGDGYVCPFLKCSANLCDGDMVIRDADIQQRKSKLTCRKCGSIVGSDEIALTRQDLKAAPPDVLFTTTEMLNQNMSNTDFRHVFGIGPAAPWAPKLVLLDEVHIYSGAYGAQVGFLLRRWSALTKFRSHFVGLSATLADGANFFAALTGLDPGVVAEISPQPDQMKREGAEYLMALRGDPVSRSALLSTSIQALMLASRILDPRSDVATRPFYGWRTFAFTDQMDSTNRLYLNMVDAEGMLVNGKRNLRFPDGGLAHLRVPRHNRYRYLGGQNWDLCRDIGHRLNTNHRVSRTTSYDQGVSSESEIVISTASLEVGYDDPDVGVVLQHKAPRDIAQFLQRKGRGGRTRHMRPWTLMVLSDYGRDRLAYQAYEQFFDPQLTKRTLPFGNRYVHRMQAVYALIDFLGVEMQTFPAGGSVWRDLRGPFKPRSPDIFERARPALSALIATAPDVLTAHDYARLKAEARAIGERHLGESHWDATNWLSARLRQRALCGLLVKQLGDAPSQEALSRYLRTALKLSDAETRPLLWDHPRPLLLSAVPTALRRLSSTWKTLSGTSSEFYLSAPLPEFIPTMLFNDLSLPEVEIKLPPSVHSDEVRRLPVLQALGEMAPGKVSRRFDQALWVAPDDAIVLELQDGETLEAPVDIDAWYDVEAQAAFWSWEEGIASQRPAFRPHAIKLRSKPDPVVDTSNAQLTWRSQLYASHAGTTLVPPSPNAGMAVFIDHLAFHTHAFHSPATVRRYATCSHATLRIKGAASSKECEAIWHFASNGVPCGIGFEVEVDAVVFALRLPDSISATVDWTDLPRVRAIRSGRYLWEARNGATLKNIVGNVFRRDWLAQIFMAATSLEAVRTGGTLSDAITVVGNGERPALFDEVMTAIFQSPLPTENEEDSPDRLRQDLAYDLTQPIVLAALQATAQALVAPIDANWDAWLVATLHQTLANALQEAIQQLCPELQTDQLVVDIEPGPRADGSRAPSAEIWITETNPGGNGLIEQFHSAYTDQPQRFFRLVETALQASDFEIIDRQMRDILARLAGGHDPDLVQKVEEVRHALGVDEADKKLAGLRRFLVEQGYAVFHGFIAALSSRLLRQDMPRAIDSLLHEVFVQWEAMQVALGIEVDSRIVAALFSGDQRFDDALRQVGFDVPEDNVVVWRFSVIYGLLWARGNVLRSAGLHMHNRFVTGGPHTERLLLSQWLSVPELAIDGAADGWHALWSERLSQQGGASISVPIAQATRIQEILSCAISIPIQQEYLNLYARLKGVSRLADHYVFSFELSETL